MLTHFISFQMGIQLLNLIFGFVVVGLLSKEEYAKFSIAFSFQTLVNTLIDLGFSNAVIGMIGNNHNDKVLVGEYIQVARFHRNRLFLVVMPLALIYFIFLVVRYEWTIVEGMVLFSSVIVFLIAQGWNSFYSPILLIHKSFTDYYRPQLISSASKILLVLISWLFSITNSFVAAWLNALSMIYNSFSYKSKASGFFTPAVHADLTKEKELRKQLWPLIPGIIFWAFQGQISVLLISLFGHSGNVAEVAALGRLGQIFVFFSAFSSVIVGPFLAKQSGKRLINYFFIVTAGAMLLTGVLSLLSFGFPQVFLLLLGKNYMNLDREVGFIMLSGSASFLAGLFYTIQTVKRWVFWWHSIANIVLTLAIQVVLIRVLSLDNTLNVLIFSIVTNAVSMCTNLIVCILSMSKK